MRLIVESTKTNAGTRKIPMTDDVARCFQGIIEEREPPRYEKVIGGYTGLLFVDKDCDPLVIILTIFPQNTNLANRRKTRQITAIKEEKPQ